jgi:serine/threonine-protein kinase HipA
MPDLSVLDVRLYDRSIGALTRLPGDKALFAFDEAYIADAERPTLSLSFKDAFGGLIADVAPTQTRLPPFFSNLLPEGSMRDYLAARAGVNPVREFYLIWALGHDLPGALKIVPFGGVSLPPSDDDLPEAPGGMEADDILRFSLAGVQLKFSAVKEASGGLTIPAEGVGGSWIVKLPSPTYPDVPENEFAMMELARSVGIDVPETFLTPAAQISGLPQGMESIGANAFVIRRFDRTTAGGAVHMEDFAQVFGLYPERKYGKASYGNIARVLWIETGEAGIVEFLRRFVFNALIGNGDMHAKNWSLIYPDRRQAQLAPAYDFVSTIAYIPNDKLALSFAGSKSFASLTHDQFARFADKVGLPEKLTRDTVRDAVERFREVWKGADAVPPKLRDAIERHLKVVPVWGG